jgi:gliding motility-associated-like protein
MKNTVILFITILQTVTTVFAQNSKQNNNWVFGRGAQVEFNNGNITTKFKMFSSREACASLSNPITGELMFYTNGESIMDKNGNLLQNGDSLNGNESSTQGALIIPHPSLNNHYLLFTTPFFATTGNGLYYSVVNMGLNNGLGGVVPNQKNIFLYPDVTEGLTYTYNNDSSGYWVLAHERSTNTFLSFEINKNGIGQNIKKSTIGRVWTTGSDFMSYMKTSANGKKLCVSNIITETTFNNISGQAEVYNFDNCTGTISDEIIIKNLPWCYGNEFSPNNQVLYLTSILFPSKVLQVNLSAGSETDINASLQTIYTAPLAPSIQNRDYYLAGMQLSEDGKIYIVETSQRFLHCINAPNNLGANCNFVPEQVNLLGGSRALYGLPPIVPFKLKDPKIILDSVTILINDTCIEKIEKAILNGINNFTSIEWRLINLSNLDTTIVKDSINYNFSNVAIGEYIIEATIKKDCKNYFASLRFTLIDCDCSGKIKISDTCIESRIELNVTSNDFINSIEWIVTDANGNMILKQKSINANLKIDSAQNINVTAIVNFTCKTDTIRSFFRLVNCPDCNKIYIPNAFSPNKDGINDVFNCTTSCEIEFYNLKIFNRWGEKIYESYQLIDAWDGTYKNFDCPDGVYVFNIGYRFKGATTTYKSGTITLLR